jgi:hypothetical protein
VIRTLRVVRPFLLALAFALALAGAATANHLDPQERIRAGDQRRAGAMLLRKVDLEPGYEPERTSGLEPHISCRALDESDFVLTGRAKSPYWAREYQIVGSSVAVYSTAADARTAWRRGTSAAGLNCLRDEFRKEFARQGETARISIRAIPLPKLAVPAKAARLAVSGPNPGQPPLLFIDIVLLSHGRALGGLLFAGVVAPPDRATEIALSRVVAQRMKAAMRGAS